MVLSVFVLAMVFAQNIYAQGCSQCKMVATQGSEMDEASFGTNINTGIIYLMLIPYLLMIFLFRKKIVKVIKALFSHS